MLVLKIGLARQKKYDLFRVSFAAFAFILDLVLGVFRVLAKWKKQVYARALSKSAQAQLQLIKLPDFCSWSLTCSRIVFDWKAESQTHNWKSTFRSVLECFETYVFGPFELQISCPRDRFFIYLHFPRLWIIESPVSNLSCSNPIESHELSVNLIKCPWKSSFVIPTQSSCFHHFSC